MIKTRHKHAKIVNATHNLHSYLDTNPDNKYGGTTDASTKHHVYNDDLTYIYYTTVSAIHRNHFF